MENMLCCQVQIISYHIYCPRGYLVIHWIRIPRPHYTDDGRETPRAFRERTLETRQVVIVNSVHHDIFMCPDER